MRRALSPSTAALAAPTTPAVSAAARGGLPRTRIGSGALFAYALFAMPLMMTALPLNILLPDFYAARTGLALTTIGLVLLATRLVDAVADPLLGAWVDAQKIGRPRAYVRPIAIAIPLLAVGTICLFLPPAGLGAAGSAWWLGATIVAAYLGYSLATVAYQAWGAQLAGDDAGRTRVTAAREGAGLIGVLIGGSMPALAGYPALLATFAVLLGATVVLLLWRAPQPASTPVPASTVMAAQPANLPSASSQPLAPYLAFVAPLRTGRARWLLAVFACNALAPAMTATVFPFFVADRLGLPAQTGWFLAAYFVAGALSMPLWIRLARFIDLPALWLIGMLGAIAAFIGTFWLGAGDALGFLLICVLSGFAFGADLALPPALLARVIDANAHTGRREGAYFGLWSFVNKLCLALAGGIALPLLDHLGYQRGAQDADALAALAICYAVVPCLLKLIAAALLSAAWRQRRF